MAIYGRRRIGKTYLIRDFFGNKPVLFFNSTGSKDGSQTEQIKHFTDVISHVFYHGLDLKEGKNWDETFALLTQSHSCYTEKQENCSFF